MRPARFLAAAVLAALMLAVTPPALLAQTQTPEGNPPAAAPAPASQTAPALPSLSAQAAPAPAPAAPAPAVPGSAADNGPRPAGIGDLPHDLSPWAMFLNADIVVKAVMVGLALASVATWTIWLAKSLQLFGARRRAIRGIRALLKAEGLHALESRQDGDLRGGPVAALVHAAEHENTRSASLPAEGIKERTAIALTRVEARAARVMSRGTSIVATIGSTAPFVGLFGTVWGIMNAFVGISRAHTTNLAVVAPGIAEALLATAIGLVAAIPAVVIYNGFSRALGGYRALLSDASAEVMRHLSRDLDRRVHPAE